MLSYLQLTRFSNAPTVVADILAGFLLASGIGFGWWADEIRVAAALMVASLALYSFGMVLNDLNDFQQDSEQRPQRPLPSGRVSRKTATVFAGGLLLMGCVAMGVACYFDQTSDDVHVTLDATRRIGAAVGVFLSVLIAIVLYDSVLKSTILSPFLMGLCRGGNLLLGASLPTAIAWPWVGDLPWDVWACAGANALFISGVTWFARKEESGGSRKTMILGLMLMLAGYGLLAFGLPWLRPEDAIRLDTSLLDENGTWDPKRLLWPVAMTLVAFPVIRRAISAISKPSPQTVQSAVIAGLGNLVFLDGMICLYAAPQKWITAVVVFAMILPIMLLKRLIPQT